MAKKQTMGSPSQGVKKLSCPECGRTFDRPPALGAHRRRAHGVVGATNAQRARARAAAGRRTSTEGRVVSKDASGGRIDRDALLRTLFPQGIPAREDVIRATSDWLDDAEQLARMK